MAAIVAVLLASPALAGQVSEREAREACDRVVQQERVVKGQACLITQPGCNPTLSPQEAKLIHMRCMMDFGFLPK